MNILEALELTVDSYWGDIGAFKLISFAKDSASGWKKTIIAMETGTGCLVQVSTTQVTQVSDSMEYVPNVSIVDVKNGDGEVVARRFVPLTQHNEY